MNTPEQLLSDSAEKLVADGTLIPRASQMTPALLPTPVAGRRRRHFVVFIFLMSLGEIALLFSLLRGVPSDLLRQEFEGLGRVVCVLAYVGTFMWHVSRGLAEDARQAEVPNPIEHWLPRGRSHKRARGRPRLAIQPGVINPPN